MKKNELAPLVSICCAAYNQEDFIGQCLEGFLMQQTNFPVEILIHDDASTDKTAEIIHNFEKNHADRIKPIYQVENKYSKGINVTSAYNFSRANGRYIALCEGDDYWTDPLKLQKQVDFLESHQGFSLACGGYIKRYTDSDKMEEVIINNPKLFPHTNKYGFEFDLNDLHKKWLTKTLTILFRKDSFKVEELSKYSYVRDVHLFYHLIKNGKGIYFQEALGVYRIHEGGTYSMNAGKININVGYTIHKELYLLNKDFYTKQMFLSKTLTKLKFDLKNSYDENDFKSRSRLMFESLRLVSTPEEFLMFLKYFAFYFYSSLTSFFK